MKTGMVFAGVGGQGVLTASSIVGEAALRAGLNVVMSEVHGMAQRGGTVVVEMNIGDAKSSLLGNGDADIVIGFEPVEAYRFLHKAHNGSYVIINTEPVIPTTASIGNEKYPDVNELIKNMKSLNVLSLNATEIARKTGNVITMNIVMLGALVSVPAFPVEEEYIIQAIKDKINPKYHELNLRAFKMGYEAVRKE